MTDERKNLAKSVKAYRKEHRLSQLEFAQDCGISDVSLCRIERQSSNVSLDTMQLLAARIGTSVAELLAGGNPITYCLIPTPVCINGEEVTTYGIGALRGSIMLDYVVDISPDYNKILDLVELCNEEGLDPIHLHEIAEDALVD